MDECNNLLLEPYSATPAAKLPWTYVQQRQLSSLPPCAQHWQPSSPPCSHLTTVHTTCSAQFPPVHTVWVGQLSPVTCTAWAPWIPPAALPPPRSGGRKQMLGREEEFKAPSHCCIQSSEGTGNWIGVHGLHAIPLWDTCSPGPARWTALVSGLAEKYIKLHIVWELLLKILQAGNYFGSWNWLQLRLFVPDISIILL